MAVYLNRPGEEEKVQHAGLDRSPLFAGSSEEKYLQGTLSAQQGAEMGEEGASATRSRL